MKTTFMDYLSWIAMAGLYAFMLLVMLFLGLLELLRLPWTIWSVFHPNPRRRYPRKGVPGIGDGEVKFFL